MNPIDLMAVVKKVCSKDFSLKSLIGIVKDIPLEKLSEEDLQTLQDLGTSLKLKILFEQKRRREKVVCEKN